MNGTRQKIQYLLALEPVSQGETPVSGYQGTEPFVAKPTTESPASAEQLMEEVCDRESNHYFNSLGLPRLYVSAQA
jgi:hypothetical protein